MEDRSGHAAEPIVAARRASLFCDTGFATRVERAEAGLMADVVEAAGHGLGPGPGAGFAIAVAGGSQCS